VQLKYISKIQDITEDGDLLIIKDVLMYLSNTDILYVISELLPKYKYALIEISAVDSMHADVKTGNYRPLKLSFENGVKVIEKKYKSTRKETWLIRNN
jgi:regulator of RNase E activity RraB